MIVSIRLVLLLESLTEEDRAWAVSAEREPMISSKVDPIERSLEQTATIDFRQLAEALKDCALTCLKLFEAGGKSLEK